MSVELSESLYSSVGQPSACQHGVEVRFVGRHRELYVAT